MSPAPADSSAHALELRKVVKTFGAVVALRSGTLALDNGSIHALAQGARLLDQQVSIRGDTSNIAAGVPDRLVALQRQLELALLRRLDDGPRLRTGIGAKLVPRNHCGHPTPGTHLRELPCRPGWSVIRIVWSPTFRLSRPPSTLWVSKATFGCSTSPARSPSRGARATAMHQLGELVVPRRPRCGAPGGAGGNLHCTER